MGEIMEFHLWLTTRRHDTKDLNFFKSYTDVKNALYDKTGIIHTYVTSFFRTDLFDMGYRLFVHFPNENFVEVKLGENECTDRHIKLGHNIEKLLLGGEFGEV